MDPELFWVLFVSYLGSKVLKISALNEIQSAPKEGVSALNGVQSAPRGGEPALNEVQSTTKGRLPPLL